MATYKLTRLNDGWEVKDGIADTTLVTVKDGTIIRVKDLDDHGNVEIFVETVSSKTDPEDIIKALYEEEEK